MADSGFEGYPKIEQRSMQHDLLLTALTERDSVEHKSHSVHSLIQQRIHLEQLTNVMRTCNDKRADVSNAEDAAGACEELIIKVEHVEKCEFSVL